MDVVHNERIKLLATFLNGIAIAVFAVGGLSPIVSSALGNAEFRIGVMITSGICILTAFGLHYSGSLVLRRLKQ